MFYGVLELKSSSELQFLIISYADQWFSAVTVQ